MGSRKLPDCAPRVCSLPRLPRGCEVTQVQIDPPSVEIAACVLGVTWLGTASAVVLLACGATWPTRGDWDGARIDGEFREQLLKHIGECRACQTMVKVATGGAE